MSEGQDRSKGYYEAKGLVRHTVIFSATHKEQLKNIAKLHSITQGEVIEVLLDKMEPVALAQYFEAKKSGKTDGRTINAELAKKIKTASPETLAAIEQLLKG